MVTSELRAGTVSADAREIIGRVPSLAGSPRVIDELPGGLTNRNYRVTTPAGTFVARIWAGDGDPRFEWRPVRPIPEDDEFFENVWRHYREDKNVY